MRKTVNLTHGAMTVALTGIILLMDRLFLGFFMPFFALPLIIYGVTYSLKDSAVVAFSNVLISVILSGLLPAVLTMIGYAFVGLAYIYAYQHKLSKKYYYLLMSIFMSIFYVVMVGFFGEYFGVSVTETIDAMATLPMVAIVDPIVIKITAYMSIVLTMLMEVIIVKVSADMVIHLLRRHRKA